jgi:hypothetical protein
MASGHGERRRGRGALKEAIAPCVAVLFVTIPDYDANYPPEATVGRVQIE